MPSKRPRKLTDEQLAAHREEAAYIGTVLTAYRAALHITQLPSEKQQRAGARWFYTAREGGQSVPPDELMEWYRLTKTLPFWQGKLLSLVSLQNPYTEHAGDLEAYRQTVERETKQQRGANNYGARANGRGTSTRAGTSGPPAPPNAKRHGVYASLVD